MLAGFENSQKDFVGLRVNDRLRGVDLSAFATSAEEYEAMAVDQRDGLVTGVLKQVEPFLDIIFAETGADWAIIWGKDAEIHSLGEIEDAPTNEQLWALVRNERIVPFLCFCKRILDNQ